MFSSLRQFIWSYNAGEPGRVDSLKLFLQILVVVGRDLLGGMLTLRAMSLVYTTLLSLVPLLAVSISVLKGFGVHDQLEPSLVNLLAPLGEKAEEISARIVGFVDNMDVGVLGALGLSFLLFTAISLIYKIESSFNYTWRLSGGRSLTQRFSDYLSVIMVGPVLVFSAFGITASLSSHHVVTALSALPYMTDLMWLLGKLLPYALVILAFTFVYILVPNTYVKPKSAFIGAVFAGFLWQNSGIFFTSFVGGSTQYTAIYSGLAVLIVFMIWLYLSWLILLIGASISFYHQNPEYLRWHNSRVELSGHSRETIALQLMLSIARAHWLAGPEGARLPALARQLRLPENLVSGILDSLQSARLISPAADPLDCFLPARAVDQIKVSEVLEAVRMSSSGEVVDQLHSETKVSELVKQYESAMYASLEKVSLADLIHEENNPEKTQ